MRVKHILKFLNLEKNTLNGCAAYLLNNKYTKGRNTWTWKGSLKDIPENYILENWDKCLKEAQTKQDEFKKMIVKRNKKSQASFDFSEDWCRKNTNGSFAYNNTTD